MMEVCDIDVGSEDNSDSRKNEKEELGLIDDHNGYDHYGVSEKLNFNI